MKKDASKAEDPTACSQPLSKGQEVNNENSEVSIELKPFIASYSNLLDLVLQSDPAPTHIRPEHMKVSQAEDKSLFGVEQRLSYEHGVRNERQRINNRAQLSMQKHSIIISSMQGYFNN